MHLSDIYAPVQEDLVQVKQEIDAVSQVDFSWLSELLRYSLGGNGKGIRPALTLLAGKFYRYDLDTLLPMAVATELLHVATLAHDDAIDRSEVRRSRPTLYKVWGEDKAVLLGDYLFAKAGELAATTRNLRVIRLFAQTLRIISTGELAQAFSSFSLEQTYEQYIQRISYKTASLFTLATESGATLSEAPEESIKALSDYSYSLGVAFQIVDDVLDFVGTEEELGKPTGSDLDQGTLTLPAMLLLERYPEDNPVQKLFQGGDKRANTERAIEMVRNSPIIDECYRVAADYCARASRSLDCLADNASHRSLVSLADFILSRKR